MFINNSATYFRIPKTTKAQHSSKYQKQNIITAKYHRRALGSNLGRTNGYVD